MFSFHFVGIEKVCLSANPESERKLLTSIRHIKKTWDFTLLLVPLLVALVVPDSQKRATPKAHELRKKQPYTQVYGYVIHIPNGHHRCFVIDYHIETTKFQGVKNKA